MLILKSQRLKFSHTNNFSQINKFFVLIEIAKQSIPNRLIKVNPMEPTWIASDIKTQILKRLRLCKKAKRANNPDLWCKFKN